MTIPFQRGHRTPRLSRASPQTFQHFKCVTHFAPIHLEGASLSNPQPNPQHYLGFVAMFTEELKAFKRLGFRHVRPYLVRKRRFASRSEHVLLQVLLQLLNFASVIASGPHDLERPWVLSPTLNPPIVVVLRRVLLYSYDTIQ